MVNETDRVQFSKLSPEIREFLKKHNVSLIADVFENTVSCWRSVALGAVKGFAPKPKRAKFVAELERVHDSYEKLTGVHISTFEYDQFDNLKGDENNVYS
ncbi:MAG: hypothetical protein ACYDG6_06615 [Thermincolia bacterium]